MTAPLAIATPEAGNTVVAATSSPQAAPAMTTGSYEYVSAVDERLCCPICQAPMVNPYMSKTCEHFYCYECILQHLSSSDSPGTCPCDRSPLSLESGPYEDKQLVPAPRLVKLLCDELEVRCTSRTKCSWAGQRYHWDSHQAQCTKPALMVCQRNCGYQGPDLQEHERTCSFEPLICNACQEVIAQELLQSHESECPRQPLTCPHCNQEDLARSEYQGHLDNSCQEITIDCSHAKFGCTWKGRRGSLALDHLESQCIFEPLKSVLGAHNEQIRSLQNENAILRMEMTALRDTYNDLDRRVRHLARGVGLASSDDTSRSAQHPITAEMASLSAQMGDLRRISDRHQVTSEHSMHEIKENMSSMQMMLHDLRGELMALQHAHHYENVYRSWGRNPSADGRTAESKTAGSSSDDAKSKDGVATAAYSTTGPLFPQAVQGYPFALYAPFPPGQMAHAPPYLGSAPGMPYGPRRWSGWPYGYPGSTSPEERAGGVKL